MENLENYINKLLKVKLDRNLSELEKNSNSNKN